MNSYFFMVIICVFNKKTVRNKLLNHPFDEGCAQECTKNYSEGEFANYGEPLLHNAASILL